MKTFIWTSDLVTDRQNKRGFSTAGWTAFLYLLTSMYEYYVRYVANKQWHLFQSFVRYLSLSNCFMFMYLTVSITLLVNIRESVHERFYVKIFDCVKMLSCQYAWDRQSWELRSSGLLRSEQWQFLTDVSGQSIRPIFMGQEPKNSP